MKRREKYRRTLYKKICKECGNEVLVDNVKDEICWRCREKLERRVKNGRE